ncbi:MAG: hypothetical protein QM726_19355 [Chitinophagaceae bacterium]
MTLNDVLDYTIDQLTTQNIKHQIHRFDSGCVMIDIWKGRKFYCVQFEKDKLGLSLVTELIDFSTIPDKWYTNFGEFKEDLEQILRAV